MIYSSWVQGRWNPLQLVAWQVQFVAVGCDLHTWWELWRQRSINVAAQSAVNAL